MSAIIYGIPKEFKDTLPDIFQNYEKYEALEKQWLADLSDVIRADNGVGQYIGQTIKFPVADGQAVYMVKQLSPRVELIHLPLMDGYQFQYAHLMTATEIIKKITIEAELEAFLNSWRVQTVGDVDKVIEAHGISTTKMNKEEIKTQLSNGFMFVKWHNIKYLLPIYSPDHNYDHGIYKYLCNEFKTTI